LKLRRLAILQLLNLLLISSCQTLPLNTKVYMANRKLSSIVREQTGERIKCDEPKFDDMVCMHEDDFIDMASRKICE
jgi:hypothetical protein